MNLRVDTGTPTVPTAPERSQVARGRAVVSGRQQELASAAPDTGDRDADINTQQVAELQAAIAEGRFTIHPERIADAILASAQGALSGDAK